MSIYFTRIKPKGEIGHPEEVEKIKNYLKSVGVLNCGNLKIESLWKEFSEKEASANFLDPRTHWLERFSYWLDKYED